MNPKHSSILGLLRESPYTSINMYTVVYVGVGIFEGEDAYRTSSFWLILQSYEWTLLISKLCVTFKREVLLTIIHSVM